MVEEKARVGHRPHFMRAFAHVIIVLQRVGGRMGEWFKMLAAKRAVQAVANHAGYEIRRRREPERPLTHHEATRGLDDAAVAELKAKVDLYDEQVKWFHSFDFGNGVVAKGAATLESLSRRVRSLGIEDDLQGASFLDIASWDGFYAFEAERRGAGRVLATDYFCWGHGGWGRKDGFLLARDALKSKVEDKDIEVQDLSPESVGRFDIVLFSGIFYHMRDPIQALAAAASVAQHRLIVETHIIPNQADAFMRYVPRAKGNENSNYWRPTMALILTLLSEMGFSRIDHRIELDNPDYADSTHGFFNAYRD
jgi:tRNA (mo5U34)-methyltransferase